MTTPAPGDPGEAPTPAPPAAPPPTASHYRETVQANKQLEELVKAHGLNEQDVRAFAQLRGPLVQAMVDSVPPETIKKLHSHVNVYGLDDWLKDHYPKTTTATRTGTALDLVEAGPQVSTPVRGAGPIDKLPPAPQPQQAPLQPSSSSRDPHGGTAASASRSQSAEATLPTSASVNPETPPERKPTKSLKSASSNQETLPKWKPNKRTKHKHDSANQGAQQKELHCPSCHKLYRSRGQFEKHLSQHIKDWFGVNFGEHDLFGCGYCLSALGLPGGDVHAATASQGWNAIVAHISYKHSKYQEDTALWRTDAAIRNVLWHDKFRSRWVQLLAGNLGADRVSSTYLSWEAPVKEKDNWTLLCALQRAGATSLPEYVPGQPQPDYVQQLLLQAYDLADRQILNLFPAFSTENIALSPGHPGSTTYGIGYQAGNRGWDGIPPSGTTPDGPLGYPMGPGQYPPQYN